MRIVNLGSLGATEDLKAEIAIVGGGPAGFAIVKELAKTKVRVLLLESGVFDEEPRFEALNAVESIGEPQSPAQQERRRLFHGSNSSSWTHEVQRFGVRCRVLGGSSQAWAGKSAAFDRIDFTKRDWIPNSGWPITADELSPYADRAGALLNLGPNYVEDELWATLRVPPPAPPLDPALLRSFFWQFSRSRMDRQDFTRFGREFSALDAPHALALVNATVTCIRIRPDATETHELEVTTIEGIKAKVRAKIVVLAASAIENPRLMLASGRLTGHPTGNQHDLVGRFLADHPSATLGRFDAGDCGAINERFGFYGLDHRGQAHMYLHGLALSPVLQKQEKLLNCAAYMMEDRAPDDPWSALRRLLRAKSSAPIADIGAVITGSELLARGVFARLLTNRRAPALLRNTLVDTLVKRAPNAVVREYRDRGWPHKLTGITIDGITEQRPDAESRLTLTNRADAVGVPVARIDWRVDEDARSSLLRMGQLIQSEFGRVGLPVPVLEPWVQAERPEDAPIIDMAHTAGTTRMSDDPRYGVVDRNCEVHGVANLFVAGASVFPTPGHANPTLMIVTLAVRLANHLKLRFAAEALAAARSPETG